MDKQTRKQLTFITDNMMEGIDCPYIGKNPSRLHCYYILIKLKASNVPYIKIPRGDYNLEKKMKRSTRFPRYETCFSCKEFPGAIWNNHGVRKAIITMIRALYSDKTSEYFKSIERARIQKYRGKLKNDIGEQLYEKVQKAERAEMIEIINNETR